MKKVKSMKKIALLAGALMLAVGLLAGCGGGDGDAATPTPIVIPSPLNSENPLSTAQPQNIPSVPSATGGASSGDVGDATHTVNADSLNIRSEPNTDSDIIGSLDRDQKVKVLEEGEWSKIQYNDKEGYVKSSYLQKIEGTSPTNPPADDPMATPTAGE
jgi:uncharacterized protein YgiM (DUF1202 family)